MRTLFALITASVHSLHTIAQLTPQANAPVAAHLIEVNAQWRTMDPASLTGEPVRFSTEAERIATHLRMVCDRLQARTPNGLSPEQRASRSQLIERLRVYADGRTFPQNHALSFRNPVFIDEHNTACAVGHLMRESGNGQLAQRVHDEMNLAYVHDITIAEVGTWGSEHGFTADELAWIQPGYPPSDPWAAFGGGTNGTVTTLKTLSNGHLLVAGEFTQAGGQNCTRVARWNGSVFEPLGNGVDGTVECAIEQAGFFLLGGSFQNGTTDIALWNGSTWTYSNAFQGMQPSVHALHIHNNELYAAGTVSGFAGTDERVRKLVGLGWQDVGGNMNAPINALATFDGELVMGGAFTGVFVFGAPDSSVLHVAWLNNGGWQQLGGGLDATVNDLEVFNGQLHAGGDLFANIDPRFGLARIASIPAAWEQLMPNLTDYIYPDLGPTTIEALHAADSTLYIGGAFGVSSGLTYGSNVAMFHGQPDVFEPSVALDGPVHDIARHGDFVVIGGGFVNGNGAVLDHVAALDLAAGIGEDPSNIVLQAWPNPAVNELNVFIGSAISSSASMLIFDATGRSTTLPLKTVVGQRTIDIGGLSSGAYVLQVLDRERSGTIPFIKH